MFQTITKFESFTRTIFLESILQLLKHIKLIILMDFKEFNYLENTIRDEKKRRQIEMMMSMAAKTMMKQNKRF